MGWKLVPAPEEVMKLCAKDRRYKPPFVARCCCESSRVGRNGAESFLLCGRVPIGRLLLRSSVRRRRPVDEPIMHDDGSPTLAVNRLIRDGFPWRDVPAFSAFTFVRNWLIRHTGTYFWLIAGSLTWLIVWCSASSDRRKIRTCWRAVEERPIQRVTISSKPSLEMRH